jgi:hypothetical protein
MSRAANLAIPALIAGLAAGAAYAGADTTFDPALTQFTLQACRVALLWAEGTNGQHKGSPYGQVQTLGARCAEETA